MSERLESPWQRWSRDPRALSHLTAEELARAFVAFLDRTVSNDRLVSIDGVDYELPRELGPNGRTGSKVQLVEKLLEGSYHVLVGDRLMRLRPVDLTANARSPRSSPGEEAAPEPPAAKTAADLAYETDLGPVVDADGGALPSRPDNPDDEETP